MVVVQNRLCLFRVIKGKGSTDLYCAKECCWLLCKQRSSNDLSTPGNTFVSGLVVFYCFQIYFKLWAYAESGRWLQWESKHSRLMRGLQFFSHSFSIQLSLDWPPQAPDWKCYTEMSCREHLQRIVVLDILSQTIFVLLKLSICFWKPNIESQVLSYRHSELE